MNVVEVDDIEAIKSVLGGETSQYRVLVEKYHRGLIRYLTNMVGDATQAEDIAQDAFVQAYKKLSSFDPFYSFSTWIYKIASNLAKEFFAKNSRQFKVIEGGLIDTDSAEDEAASTSRAKSVRDAVATLKPDYQQVINLFYWENKTYEEIAIIVDCPIGTVRTWLSRSKEQLEEQLYGQV